MSLHYPAGKEKVINLRDDLSHTTPNPVSRDNLPCDHMTNTPVLLSKNALILHSKNLNQDLPSHQKDFPCQAWQPSNSGRWQWQFPSRARCSGS